MAWLAPDEQREWMVGIHQLRLTTAQPRVAQQR
jgi:hypothetical protein